MLKNLKRVISGVLVATIVLSFAGENLVQVQAAEVSTDSVEKLEASDVKYTVSPREIKMPVTKYDLCVSDYGKPRKDTWNH